MPLRLTFAALLVVAGCESDGGNTEGRPRVKALGHARAVPKDRAAVE